MQFRGGEKRKKRKKKKKTETKQKQNRNKTHGASIPGNKSPMIA